MKTDKTQLDRDSLADKGHLFSIKDNCRSLARSGLRYYFPNAEMRLIIYKKIMPFITISIFLLLICSCGKVVKKNDTTIDARTKRQLFLSKIENVKWLNQYNVLVNWEDMLVSLNRPALIVDLQRILETNDNPPLIFFASIEEAKKNKEGKYLVRFKTYVLDFLEYFKEDSRFFTWDSQLELVCSEEQINRILGNNWGTSPETVYAIIAEISDIERPILRLTAETLGESDPIIQSDSPDIILIRGKCLDFKEFSKAII